MGQECRTHWRNLLGGGGSFGVESKTGGEAREGENMLGGNQCQLANGQGENTHLP